MLRLSILLFATLLFFAKASSCEAQGSPGIPESCSIARFAAVSLPALGEKATFIRLRILPTYEPHQQITISVTPAGDLQVEVLEVREGATRAQGVDDACPPLVLRQRMLSGRSRQIRKLFTAARTIKAPVFWPPWLYLDSTTYQLTISEGDSTTEFSWIGLEEEENLGKYEICGWAQQLRKAVL